MIASPLATTAPAAPAPPPSTPTDSSTAAPAPVTAAPTPVLGVGVEPARLSVPAMDLEEALIPLGIAADGTMEVPVDYDDVGWFSGGGRPGGTGRTVIAAHVDSRSGPAVFFRLRELAVDDEIELTGVDGSLHRYRVTATESHPKAAFPTAAVFGGTLEDEVVLVTCAGAYDTGIGRYEDNLVVFASRT
ncbi:class F sortase [Rathayibacter sp. VKM Ac-2630]|uniref:class F sortase n=1 Tax=Rathayibacter sp. VKM Ac-2630 TaxID=1938617 RepID=UPI001F3E0EF9|nr:class F sortase [Rathayibacter sp. VKM Ac-2630]